MPEKIPQFSVEPTQAEKFRNWSPDPVLLEKLKTISRIVGGDFGMSVEIGRPGEGSYFDMNKREIKFDPLHFEPGKEWQMEFIAGHEGGHRAIDRSPREIGGEAVEKNWEDLSWGFLSNVMADCAMNSWVAGRYEGYADLNKRTYDEMFQEEHVVVGNPEVHRMRQRLGYDPHFAVFGSEIMRKWHTGEHSIGLDAKVVESLQKTESAVLKVLEAVPSASSESEILTKAKERYAITRSKIWPEMRKLMEEDLENEKLRRMIEGKQKELTDPQAQEKKEEKKRELDEKSAEIEKEIEELEKQKKQSPNDENIDKQLADKKSEKRELEKQKKELDQEPDMSADLAKQLKEVIERAKEETTKSLEEENKNLAQKAKDLHKQAQQESDPLTKAQMEEQIKKLSEQFKANKELQKQIEDGQAVPMPMDKLPQELKEALEEAFEKLPAKEKKELKEQAKETLENLEDGLNDPLKPKIGPDQPQSHSEKRREEQESKEERDRKREEKKREREVRAQLEKVIEENLTSYQKTYREVSQLVDDVYSYLAKFFMPKRHPRYKGGYESGQRAQIQRAMEYEAKVEMRDQSAKVEFWERLNLPEKHDYKFTILVDLSGSMNQGNKLSETFKALIVFVEVLNRLGMDFSVDIFSDDRTTLKGFSEKIEEAKRNKLASEMYSRDMTYIGSALSEAEKDILEQKGKQNFIIVLTDGDPTDGATLKDAILEAGKKKIKVIGLGLGSGTDAVANNFPVGLPNLEVDQLKTVVAKLLATLVMFPDLDEQSLREDLELIRQGKKGKIIQSLRPDEQAVIDLNNNI